MSFFSVGHQTCKCANAFICTIPGWLKCSSSNTDSWYFAGITSQCSSQQASILHCELISFEAITFQVIWNLFLPQPSVQSGVVRSLTSTTYSSYLKAVHFLASSSLGELSVWSHTAAWRMHLHFVWKTGTWYLIGRLRVGWPIFVSVMLLWEVSLSLDQIATARVGGLSTTWNDDHIAKIMANASFSITV